MFKIKEFEVTCRHVLKKWGRRAADPNCLLLLMQLSLLLLMGRIMGLTPPSAATSPFLAASLLAEGASSRLILEGILRLLVLVLVPLEPPTIGTSCPKGLLN